MHTQHHKPLDPKYGDEPSYDFESVDEDSACPKNYRPNPAKPPVEKTYYRSPKRIKGGKRTNVKNRPEWKSTIETPRKQSIKSDISTLSLHESDNDQPFKTVANPAESVKPSRKTSKPVKKSRSLPSLSPKMSPSTSLGRSMVDYSHLDKYKPPPQYLTTRERMELLRAKQEKERNNNMRELTNQEKKTPVSKSKDHNEPVKGSRKPEKQGPRSYESEPPKKEVERKTSFPTKKVTEKQADKPSFNEKQKKKQSRTDPSSVYNVPNKKVRSVSDSTTKSLKVSDSSSGYSSRTSSISNTFTDMKNIKSASVSIASTASSFATRTKVIQFNDKKQSLGSTGMATITKLNNSFKVRQFPDGAGPGYTRAVKMMESNEWEQNVEGLELLASLASQHSEVSSEHLLHLRNYHIVL